ncbi:putative nucleotidyltransferase substrate binding domain-containing protein [Mycobacteroides salmoniphilum]|uniref:putative nucleotidyltransferase substrate binding domain-containing protein n=1 Tax=Mycobacteroides salmoniphilum TaxID=404941 RepID=UPI000992EF09|nr:putative nucleotidyltransferase substrate binding domain-containing protein [Mycobacteroides salmoniphilum]QCH24143.1 Putative nucleotidyltransferase substrate binding domain protein [Mycobacteroides salmoniphilum]
MSADVPPANGIAQAIAQIDTAADEAEFCAAVGAARMVIALEVRVRTPEAALAAAWSEALRHSIGTAARLVTGGVDPGWTWFVSGSVARGEAAPGSDIETLLAVDDALDGDGKTHLMELAAQVHAMLERGGIGSDSNGVLASRGRFCRRASNWFEGIERWCANPPEDRGVVMAGLMADSHGVGAGSLLSDNALRTENARCAQRHYPIRLAMLQDAVAIRAGFPSRLRIFATQSDTVDLKVAAIDPVVKIARWAALSAGADALSTPERLDAAAGNILDADDASTLRDCFAWLLRFRWRSRATAWQDGEHMSDIVSLSALAPQERAVLRSVAREIAGIRRKLIYLSSTSSFR